VLYSSRLHTVHLRNRRPPQVHFTPRPGPAAFTIQSLRLQYALPISLSDIVGADIGFILPQAQVHVDFDMVFGPVWGEG
jgi:hypothetical protein